MIGIFGPGLTTGIGGALLVFLEQPHAISLEGGGLERLIAGLAGQIALELMLPILVLVILALLAGVAQSGINISGESLKPKLEKLSLLKGLGRIFSLRGLTEFAKGIAKLLIVSAVIGFVVYPELERVPSLVTISLAELMGLMQELALKILIAVLFVMAVIAALWISRFSSSSTASNSACRVRTSRTSTSNPRATPWSRRAYDSCAWSELGAG